MNGVNSTFRGDKLVPMRIGIDLGGSKIEGLVLDPNGREKARKRVPTPGADSPELPPEETYAAIVKAIAGLVAGLAAQAGADGSAPVGVGIPGEISPATGLVKNANSTCLIGHALDQDLAAAMARPVRLANDADCFTISEATDGAGQSHQTVFGVILGTGCGGGIAIGGKLLSGPNAIAGEWGHNPLPWPQTLDGSRDERPGPDCYCGKQGCIETFVSGPGLERDFHGAGGNPLSAAEIVALAQTGGDPGAEDAARGVEGRSPDGDINNEARLALRRYEHRLARALAVVINILDPDIIVLGGGMSNAARLYTNVPKLWGEWVFSDTVTTRLAPARHGDASGVRGAAWLW